jgi:hypothetical protein
MSTKWTRFLPKIVDLYNNTPHRAHNSYSTPQEVYDDEDYGQKLFEGQFKKNDKIFTEFSTGDRVRLLLGKGKFEKESARYSTELLSKSDINLKWTVKKVYIDLQKC